MLYLKLLEKEEQANHKTSRRRDITKIRAEINEIKTKIHKKKSMKQSWIFEKIKKIDRTLANLTKMRRENTKFVKSEMQKWR
jgi:hypothetical protein